MDEHLSSFQERNKPKQPPKLPKAAPFFLPTIPGLEPKFAIPEEKEMVRDILLCVVDLICETYNANDEIVLLVKITYF